MGLSAIQTRLLTLTARSSDLEHVILMINAREQLIAAKTEELATQYYKKLHYDAETETQASSPTQSAITILNQLYTSLAAKAATKPSIGAFKTDVTSSTRSARDSITEINVEYAQYINGAFTPLLKAMEGNSVEDLLATIQTMTTNASATLQAAYPSNTAASPDTEELTFDNEAFSVEYESQINLLNLQEKKFDTERKAAEIQRNEAITEIEAAIKLRDKAAKDSFGTLGGN